MPRSIVARLIGAAALALTAAVPASAEKFAVSQYGIVLSTLPWAVALEKDMFKAEGLSIDGIVGSTGGGTTVRNMLATDLPFADVAVPAAVAARKSGLDLRIVYNSVNSIGELAWVARKDSGIKTIKDLAGKKAAYSAPRSTTESLLKSILKKEGILDKVTTLPAGGMGPALTLLNNGGIDAAPIVDPHVTVDADKYQLIFRVIDYIPDLSWAVGVTTAKFAEEQPEKIRALIRARRKAVDFIYANPAETAKIYAKYWNIKEDVAARLLPKFYAMKFWSRGDFNMKGLQAMLDGMLLVGEIDTPADAATLPDRRFLPDDLKN